MAAERANCPQDAELVEAFTQRGVAVHQEGHHGHERRGQEAYGERAEDPDPLQLRLLLDQRTDHIVPAERFDAAYPQPPAYLLSFVVVRRTQPDLIRIDGAADQVQIVQIGDDNDLLLLDSGEVVVDAADDEIGAHTDAGFQNHPQVQAVADAQQLFCQERARDQHCLGRGG